MTGTSWIYATGAVIVLYFLWQVVSKQFDPFAPIWLFLVGYIQLYIIQAFSLNEWGVGVRGIEVVNAANFRAFWALTWFLIVYQITPGRRLASGLPAPPTAWSVPLVVAIAPALIAWGFWAALAVVRQSMGVSEDPTSVSAEVTLLRSFPFVMMVAGVLLYVSGRKLGAGNQVLVWMGLVICFSYVMIWMFNGKRSHSLIGVLSTVCAVYVTRGKRPSWPVLFTTAFAGTLVVAVAIGWRNNINYERSVNGFVAYLADFEVTSILKSLNLEDEYADEPLTKFRTYESLEYGAFLLMLDTVPAKSDYDYGVNYLRTFSTFIPRIVWPDKPIYGREQWIRAWQAGSEMKRNEEFTGPAIGILGATQLNGGELGTICVLGIMAVFLRGCHEFFRKYEAVPWIQAWWALSYFNAWFMVVNDDPMVWFYYNWGFTSFPVLTFLWLGNKLSAEEAETRGSAASFLTRGQHQSRSDRMSAA